MKTRFIFLLSFLLLTVISCDKAEQISGTLDAKGTFTATFKASKDFLLIPSTYKHTRNTIDIAVDGQSIFEASTSISLPVETIDYNVPVDIRQYKGRTINLTLTGIAQGSPVADYIYQSNDNGVEFNEFFRPVYHFAPDFGWNNDPNGLFLKDGIWHMSFQHNPFSVSWGNMSWGHATSSDFMHWDAQAELLRPDELGSIFSGSAVVDKNNDAGFGKDAILAFYTSSGRGGQQQSVAYSLDGGYTYTKYDKNPIIKAFPENRNSRDPQINFIGDQWVMALSFNQQVRFLGSKNLLDWTVLSDFGEGIGCHEWGTWECPGFIPVKWKGEDKWVLMVSIDQSGPNKVRTTQYFIGEWNGTEFVADDLPYPLWLDYGVGQYAGTVFNNVEGRNVWIGWLTSSPFPGSETPATKYFAGGMTLPRELTLKDNGIHPIISSVPAREVYAARSEGKALPIDKVNGKVSVESLLDNNNGAFEIEMTFVPENDGCFGFVLKNSKGEDVTVTFDPAAGKIHTDLDRSGNKDAFPANMKNPVDSDLVPRSEYKVEFFFDRMSAEMFVNDGDEVMTNCVFPSEYYNTLEVFSGTDLTVRNPLVFQFK